MTQRLKAVSAVAGIVALLCWGTYTLLIFLGAPNHTALLLSQEQQSAVAQVCPDGSLLCRGFHSLLPVLSHALAQAKPFLWYAIACLALIGIEIVWRWRRRHANPSRFSISPFHLSFTFIGLVWLLFTTLGLQGNTRLLPEPTAEAFPTAATATLQTLQQSFAELEARDCLGPARTSDQGIEYHALKPACMQQAFATRVLPQFLVVLLVTLELLVLGRFLLIKLRAPPQSALVEAVFCIGLGICGWIVLLWVLGVVSALRPVIVWTAVLLIPIVCLYHTRYWLQQFIRQTWFVDLRTDWPQLLLGWLLVSMLALNFLQVVRPLPLGFDDLNSYLMRPRALAALGQSIYSTATFQWEYLTSLGFVLFGHDTAFGATAALMINWLAGPLAVSVLLAFVASFLRTDEVKRQEVGERPSQDDSQGCGERRSKSRVQDGLSSASQHRTNATKLATGGLLAGCLYYAMPMVSHFSYADMKVDNAVFFMGALATLALYLYLFRTPTDDIPSQVSRSSTEHTGANHGSTTRSLLILAGLLAGFAFAMKFTAAMVGFGLFIVLALVVWIENRRIRPVVPALTLFALSAAVGVVPWLVHNTLRYREAMPLPVSTAPKIHDVHFSIAGINPNAERPSTRTLPADLAIDTAHANCQLTDRSEELDRYWGPDRGVERYSTLWWRTVMNLDVGGFYVTMFPAILLAPLVLLLTAFWSRELRWARWLAVFTGVLFVLWTFLANGVPWYGIGTLLGLLLGLEFLASRAVWRPVRISATLFVALSIVIALSMRFSQFEKERVILDFALGKQSANAIQEILAPSYSAVREIVLERVSTIPERPYLYQVGTFIPYFLADNPSQLGLADNQLGFFNCLYQERDASLAVRRLQALGFNSIIFDTGTLSIERDSTGSLHQKVNAFVEFVNNPVARVQTVINDPQSSVIFLLLP